MKSFRGWPALVPVALVVVACGGANFTDLGDGGPGADGSNGSPDAAGNATDGNGGNDATNPPVDGNAPPVDAPMTADGPAPPCPDVTGGYSIAIVDGSGCGDLNANAPQCIRAPVAGGGACDVVFASVTGNVSVPAINSPVGTTVSIQNDGSFTGASLREGTGLRTGCTGTWNAGSSVMTVDCGGTDSGQSCIVSLTRTKLKCG